MSRLEQLQQKREEKRSVFQSLFDRKRSLQKELDELDATIEHCQEELFQLDDDIEEEENNPTDSHHEQIPTQILTQVPQDELLTDPMTQLPSDNAAATTPPTAASTAAALSSKSAPRTILNFIQPSASSTVSRSFPAHVRPDSTRIRDTLCRTFRIPSFRENQLEIIQATLASEDCFVIMRTGGGKSLLYQLPVALERPRITLVISPLLSLMEDQEDQMNQFVPGSCVSFHSGLSKTQQAENWHRVRDPSQQVGMILVTPERVHKSQRLKSELQNLHAANRFARIVIDECHCCCQWGHDFRPDYAKLGVLRSTFANVPILAVTATASERVRQDCVNILKLQSHHRFFRSTANRPNLTYSIERKDGSAADTIQAIVDFIRTKHPNSAGIIYTFTRKDANTVALQLREQGITAEAYHSDVSPTKKTKVHKSWMQNKTQVVVATIAFGLGINKPDVRFVLHHCISKTLEAYYQESGRAGRDGNPADCVLYYSPKDVPRMLRMVHGEQSQPLVWTMIKYAQQFGSDAVCRTVLLQNLGEPNQERVMQEALQRDMDTKTPRDITAHAQTCLQLLYTIQDEKVTLPMLVKHWRANPQTAPECVQNNPPGKDLNTFECEYIIVSLMAQKLIGCDVQYTAYDTVIYLRCTDMTERFLTSPRAQMILRLPEKPVKPKGSTTPKTPKSTGWIEKKTTKTKARASTKKRAAPTKRKSTAAAKSATAKKPRKTTKRASTAKSKPEPEIIDLNDDTTTDDEAYATTLRDSDDEEATFE